jgi:hypothetical protein
MRDAETEWLIGREVKEIDSVIVDMQDVFFLRTENPPPLCMSR